TLIQDRKQNGEWGKPRKQRIPRWQIADLPNPDDRQIFAMLAGSREQLEYRYYGYNYQDAYDTIPFRHRLTAPLPQILLPLIARTGRCYQRLDSDSDDLVGVIWDEGEPWRFSVQVSRADSPAAPYIAEGVLRRGDERLDFAKPFLLLQGGLVFSSENASALDDGGAFHWISILRRTGAISVPENQIGEFMTEVLSKPHPPRLDLPEELRYEEVTVKPQPCLTFKSQQYNSKVRARLSFAYATKSRGSILEKDDPRRGVYEVENKRYLLRDTAFESAAANRLGELGLRYAGPTYYERQSGWEVASSKLPRLVRELVAEGWHVEAEGKTF